VTIRHHFHGCKAPLARTSHVKWHYTKYLAVTHIPVLQPSLQVNLGQLVPPLTLSVSPLSHQTGKWTAHIVVVYTMSQLRDDMANIDISTLLLTLTAVAEYSRDHPPLSVCPHDKNQNG